MIHARGILSDAIPESVRIYSLMLNDTCKKPAFEIYPELTKRQN
jgi:hypothetical protein